MLKSAIYAIPKCIRLRPIMHVMNSHYKVLVIRSILAAVGYFSLPSNDTTSLEEYSIPLIDTLVLPDGHGLLAMCTLRSIT